MSIDAILADVSAIIRHVLDTEDLAVVLSTTAKDIPEWDSLSNVQIVVAVEKRFNIRFTLKEIKGFRNVGEMCFAIEAKANASS